MHEKKREVKKKGSKAGEKIPERGPEWDTRDGNSSHREKNLECRDDKKELKTRPRAQ